MGTDKLTFSEDVKNLNPGLEQEMMTVPASKYRNVRAEAKGMRFQSGKEAAGVMMLIEREERGEIFALRLQVGFPLPGKVKYIADAVYLDSELRPWVVDFKGHATREFRIKARLFKERYGQEIEVL